MIMVDSVWRKQPARAHYEQYNTIINTKGRGWWEIDFKFVCENYLIYYVEGGYMVFLVVVDWVW